MVNSRALKVNFNRSAIGEEIYRWSLSKERVLNVISTPYSSPIIFLHSILKHAYNGEKIIYITNEEEKNIEMINCIKKFSLFRDYSYARNNVKRANSALVVADYNHAILMEEEFDVVIYDDISSFPRHGNYEIIEAIMNCTKSEAKIITYSIEAILKNGRELIIPVSDEKMPLVEPRIITTRIDISKDIPYVIYDYLNFSIESDRNVVIYVPDSERAESVYGYLLNYRKNLGRNIICTSSDRVKARDLSGVMRGKKGIIITDCSFDANMDLRDSDIMVYFADDKVFDYKKLVYFCGRVGRGEISNKGEVIFLSNEESEDMEKAKSITRNFNKEAWELGLLNI